MKTKLQPAFLFLGGVVVTLIILALLGVFSGSSVIPGTMEKTAPYTAHSLVGATEITCTYPQVLSVNYMNGTISQSIPAPEKEPFIFTFSDLESNVAKVKSIDSTRTISEAPLMKINETADRYVFLEGTGDSYVTTHYIFKDSGVAIYTKGVDLLGYPVGSLAMGTCVGI